MISWDSEKFTANIAGDAGDVGVFMGNWLGSNRAYGVKRGERVFVELYPIGE